jgi:hypothetical protein
MIESRRDTSEISDSISIRVLKRAGVDLIDHGSLPPSWSGAEGLVQMDSRGHPVSCEFMNRRSSGTVVASEWFISFAGRIEIPKIGPQSHTVCFANSWTTPGARRSAAAKFTAPAEIAPRSTIRPAEDISTDFTFDRGARMLPRSAAKITLAYQNRPRTGCFLVCNSWRKGAASSRCSGA